ncbi:MAG TPA: transposase [Longimicrobiaceae bacterium]|nr:transposase [Longimicrobiaceae bacterium]
MRCTTKYVGLDVNPATTLSVVRDGNGKIIAQSILPTEEVALLEFVAGMRGAVHVAFEEGTQAQWLHDLLSPRVARVVVCNRRGAAKQGNKGDRVDAGELADRLRAGRLRAVYHGRSDRLVLKELTRTCENLVEDSVRAMLRMKALFRARAIRTQGEVQSRSTRRRAGGAGWIGFRTADAASAPRRWRPSST